MNGIPADGLAREADGSCRCGWGAAPEIYREYHDTEWGRPVRDDFKLFEKLCLEGFQSGLSWLTILKKRENFRSAFAGFDFDAVADFGDRKIEELMQDAGIVRHRGKISSTINNARRSREIVREFGSLAAFLWSWEPTVEMSVTSDAAAFRVKTTCPEAIALSRELKRRGWSFVGPTTVYSFMQAVGMVNDHLEGCDARMPVEKERAKFRRPGKLRIRQKT